MSYRSKTSYIGFELLLHSQKTSPGTLSVGAIAILFPHSRIDYVDIDRNWRWFVIFRVSGQLFTELVDLQLPALDFNLL